VVWGHPPCRAAATGLPFQEVAAHFVVRTLRLYAINSGNLAELEEMWPDQEVNQGKKGG